jgi:hypothetical protein
MDNLKGKLDSKILEAMMTADYRDSVTVRAFRKSGEVIPGLFIHQASTNGLLSTKDFMNRSVVVRIRKNPEDKQYTHPDILDHIRSHQGKYLGAIHRIVEEWINRGKKESALLSKESKMVTDIRHIVQKRLLSMPASARAAYDAANAALNTRLARKADTKIDLDSTSTKSAAVVVNSASDRHKEGKPNLPFIESRKKVHELQWQLDAAIKELQAEEAKGSWIDQLDAEIRKAETALLQLLNDYANAVSDNLVRGLIGKSSEFKTALSEIKSIVKYHERLTGLRKFNLAGRDPLPQRLGPDGRLVTDSPALEFLYARAEQVAKKLDELRSHIAAEEQERP